MNNKIVVLLEPSSGPRLVNMIDFPMDIDAHSTLNALSPKFSLGLYIVSNSDHSFNKIATKLHKYLKFSDRVIDNADLFGSVILYDDKSDIDKDKWTEIRTFVNTVTDEWYRKNKIEMDRNFEEMMKQIS